MELIEATAEQWEQYKKDSIVFRTWLDTITNSMNRLFMQQNFDNHGYYCIVDYGKAFDHYKAHGALWPFDVREIDFLEVCNSKDEKVFSNGIFYGKISGKDSHHR